MSEYLSRLYASFIEPGIMLSGWLPSALIFIIGLCMANRTKKLNESIKDISEKKEKTEIERISDRFKEVLNLWNVNNKEITFFKLWEILGLESPEIIENSLLGKSLLTYELIRKFSKRLGVSYEWLSEGKGTPFYIGNTITDLPSNFISSMRSKFKDFYLIRSQDAHGKIFVVTKSENIIKYNIFPTTWLSNNPYLTENKKSEYKTMDYYDDNDKKLLANLYEVLNEHLYSSDINFHSLILSEEDFNNVLSGKIYIGKYIDNPEYRKGINWWRDFGDMNTPEDTLLKDNDECIETHKQIQEYLEKEKFQRPT